MVMRDGRGQLMASLDYLVTGCGDLLSDPERTLVEIDEVLEMQLSPELLPASNDAMPLGTPPDGKWYPLRPDVDKKYLREISDSVVEAVDERCGDLAERLGYTPDGP